MNENDKRYEKRFGLDKPMDEAVASFSKLTKQELEAEGKISPLVADGELELIAFKGAEIRRVCHNDEWWYSIVDIVGALVGTDRASKYWNDVKTKLTDEEGFLNFPILSESCAART